MEIESRFSPASSGLSSDGRYRIDLRDYPPTQQGDSIMEGQVLVDVASGEVILETNKIQCNAQLVFGPNELVTLRVPGWRRQVWIYLLDPSRRLAARAENPTDWLAMSELPAMVRAPSVAESEANLVEWQARQSQLAKLRTLLIICVAGILLCGAIVFLPLALHWRLRAGAGVGLILFAIFVVLGLYYLLGRK